MTHGLSITEHLREARFLDGLSAGELAKVGAIASIEQLEQGTVLFQERAVCENFYLIRAGLVALDMCLPRRGCQRIMTVGPGELVGWSALLADARMTALATALEATTLLVFPAQPLRALCDADHDVGYAIMKQVSLALSRRLLATRLQMLDVLGETQPITAPATSPSMRGSRSSM